MLGFVTAVTEIVPREAMREAVREAVPAGTEELNLKAFDAGVNHFDETYGQGAPDRKSEAAVLAELGAEV